MKILKLLNKKNLSIIIISLLLSLPSVAEEKPVDIWNLEKQESDSVSEENLSLEKTEQESQSSIYKMQADKNKDSIKLFDLINYKDLSLSILTTSFILKPFS